MKRGLARLCVFPKDVQRITGRSERYSRMYLEKIRVHLSKTDNQFISVEEFCNYAGLKEDQVLPYLVD